MSTKMQQLFSKHIWTTEICKTFCYISIRTSMTHFVRYVMQKQVCAPLTITLMCLCRTSHSRTNPLCGILMSSTLLFWEEEQGREDLWSFSCESVSEVRYCCWVRRLQFQPITKVFRWVEVRALFRTLLLQPRLFTELALCTGASPCWNRFSSCEGKMQCYSIHYKSNLVARTSEEAPHSGVMVTIMPQLSPSILNSIAVGTEILIRNPTQFISCVNNSWCITGNEEDDDAAITAKSPVTFAGVAQVEKLCLWWRNSRDWNVNSTECIVCTRYLEEEFLMNYCHHDVIS